MSDRTDPLQTSREITVNDVKGRPALKLDYARPNGPLSASWRITTPSPDGFYANEESLAALADFIQGRRGNPSTSPTPPPGSQAEREMMDEEADEAAASGAEPAAPSPAGAAPASAPARPAPDPAFAALAKTMTASQIARLGLTAYVAKAVAPQIEGFNADDLHDVMGFIIGGLPVPPEPPASSEAPGGSTS